MSKRQMLINYVPGEECRIAIIENDQLEEIYQERASSESHVGNIYKGRVLNVEPSIQAAFIDFGLDRNGFLHISDLHPMYFGQDAKEDSERVGMKTPRRDRPPIQKCLSRGQEILVQVLKEGIGTKGPTLTSYLSIPGRYLVMMPHMEKMGVSRKIEDDEARRDMRRILDELDPPSDFGFIIRTAGVGQTKTELKRDLAYLQRLWKAIDQRMKGRNSVGVLYAESDLLIRTIRDVFTTSIERIIVDNVAAAKRAKDYLAIANPRTTSRVMVYRDPVPIFYRYGVESQIENINAREVPLKSGGSLVIDSTEALVAIDVNSGKNRDNKDAESTAYKTNIEATDEVCRQLRLRDLGGVVVIDLIDMVQRKHRRDIEQRFRNNLKNDRARTHTLPISDFGILEMTRQRMRPSLKKSIYMDCPNCHGAGQSKSIESVVLDVMRRLALILHHEGVVRVELTISPDVAFYLLNHAREQLVSIERRHGKSVMVRVGGGSVDYVHINGFDSQDREVSADGRKGMGEPTLLSVERSLAEDAAARAAAPVDAGDAAEPALDDSLVGGEYDLGDLNDPSEVSDEADSGDAKPKRRRRRRRGGRGRGQKAEGDAAPVAESDQPANEQQTDKADHAKVESPAVTSEAAVDGSPGDDPTVKPKPKRRRRGGRGRSRQSKAKAGGEDTGGDSGEPAEKSATADDTAKPAAPPKRRRRSGRKPTATPVAAPAVVADKKDGYSNRVIKIASDSGAQEAPSV